MRIRLGIVLGGLLVASIAATPSCGGGDTGSGGSAANKLGVGADCTKSSECDVDAGQACLTNFKGGYCGVEGCTKDADCPSGSACVAHTDGKNYCFLLCTAKEQCNEHRSVETEANCSSSITFVDANQNGKACVPPS